MFKRSFSFQGRIRRTEFGLSHLIYIVCAGVIANVTDFSGTAGLLLVLYIPMAWFLLAQGVKRCHDRGNNGFFLLIPFYLFWMLFADSITGENEYGPNPKGIGNYDEIDEIGKDMVA